MVGRTRGDDGATIPKSGTARRAAPRSPAAASPDEWSPPDFGGHRQTRIGASIVEQFVAGHDAGDVLRELVQNEFDGGGDRLDVTFGTTGLDVAGSGRGVTPDGWRRLSVIVGTGRVVGDAEAERVTAKTNGIGSKNFGMRSLFLFGDELFVRSGGSVCVLDLRTLETGRMRDPAGQGAKGVRLRIPYRRETFETLEPFTAEREARAFETMAGGVLATLVKLALPGRRPGLRQLTLRSSRSDRTLSWRQSAEAVATKKAGVTAVRRAGRLLDENGGSRSRRDFEEMEFARFVEIPAKHAGKVFAAYFAGKAGMVRIAVSLPLGRRGLDAARVGHFHYPLQTPDARTGCLVGVSAPLDLDSDRSSLVDSGWNDWLADEAARLTVDLLPGDWTGRFGPAAYRAVSRTGSSSPSRFLDEVHRRLREDACWPTRATGDQRLATAKQIVIPAEPALDGFLAESRYLEPALAGDDSVRELALACGATRFTPSSLVRLRCAGADRKALWTCPAKVERHVLSWPPVARTGRG